jgi:thioredoxin reductase
MTLSAIPPVRDPASVMGKQPPISEFTDLLIIGAGPAGLSAALSAAGSGARVTLVDENPVPIETMGEDVPLHFGGRMAATLANHNAVLAHMLEANPKLTEAVEAGIDVRLGTVVWGLFPQHPTAAWIDCHVAGLAEAGRAYLMRFKQVIVAAGRRDMGLAFEGWQHPGVMGASAAYRLATTYDALDAKVAVLVGSGTDALQIGNALMDAGVRIEAIIEQAQAIQGSPRELARLTDRGVRLFTGHVVQQAFADSFGVIAVTLAGVDAQGRRVAGELKKISCDTVLLAVAAIPSIELIEACGCEVRFQALRGGHAPVIDESQRTSLPFVYVAGDCAGTSPSKTASGAAAREGRLASLAALRALGLETRRAPDEPAASADETALAPDDPALEVAASRMGWVRASIVESAFEPYVCQCEEITAAEITSLLPPRYLGWKSAARNLAALDRDGPPSPDAVKRLTRAGMGTCQGRRCREQIAALLALACGAALEDIPLASYRPPSRPLPLNVLAGLPEAPAMNEHWDSWFGMASQWVPFWRVPPTYTASARAPDEPAGGE